MPSQKKKPVKKVLRKKAADSPAKKRKARKLSQQINAELMFVNYQMTAKAIAETLGLTEKTVGDWRSNGNWDEKRKEFFANPLKIRQVLLAELLNVAEGNASNVDADALSKIVKALDSMSDKISPPVVVAVMELLDNFLADYNPQLAVDSLDGHRAFIQHIISIHG